MTQGHSGVSYVATAASLHPGKNDGSFSIWLHTDQGAIHVEMSVRLASGLADQIAAELHRPPPRMI